MCTTKKREVRGACELENIVYEREDRPHLSSSVNIDSACIQREGGCGTRLCKTVIVGRGESKTFRSDLRWTRLGQANR